MIPTYNLLFDAMENIEHPSLKGPCAGCLKLKKYYKLTDLSPVIIHPF